MWPQYAVLYIIVLPDVAARGPQRCRLRDGAGRWRQEAAGWTQWTLCPGQAEEVAAPPPPPQQGEVGPLIIWDSSREMISSCGHTLRVVIPNTAVSTSSAQYRVLDI